jgi:hypothetical protein
MTNPIRARLEALISDPGMFNAGQQHERQRLKTLIALRIEELMHTSCAPNLQSRIEEMQRTLFLLEP